jgi:TonB family protein
MFIMKTRQLIPGKIIRFFVLIFLSATLIFAVVSCSGSRAAKTQKEISPPPPPPPPPAKQEGPSEIFVVVEEMPQFPGGDTALIKFINNNIKYPLQAKVNNIQGRVILRFSVNFDGTIGKVQVLRSVDPSLDAEAIRVLNMMPKWQPGKQGGEPVNVWYSIPITFALSSSEQFNKPRFIVTGNDTIYTSIKEMPQFQGGKDALSKFKVENLIYPEASKLTGLDGTVYVMFTIGENGSLSDFSISNGIIGSLDAEALRVAKLMPAWQPGVEKGKAVKVRTGTAFNFVSPVNANSPDKGNKEVFVVVEKMPIFPGGDSTLMKFISNNIRYPKAAKEKNIQGRVILRFCVTDQGNVSRIGVLKSIDPELDAEAMRVLKQLPKWQPGMQGGKPVNVWYAIPVSFVLDGGKISQPPVTPLPPPLISGYDEPPAYNGGESALFKFLQSKVVYPQAAKEKGISGTVIINFCITETGGVDNATIRESVDSLLDIEAQRVVKLLPDWKPGKLKGTAVKVYYNVPITFALK